MFSEEKANAYFLISLYFSASFNSECSEVTYLPTEAKVAALIKCIREEELAIFKELPLPYKEHNPSIAEFRAVFLKSPYTIPAAMFLHSPIIGQHLEPIDKCVLPLMPR